MVRGLIQWSLNNPLIVCFLAVALTAMGGYAFFNVNVEAYPDPAPAIVEVIAKYPGASAEEVERQVTIPLEVALAGMPGLNNTRSKSLFGLSHLRNQFDYGVDFLKARQEVINRLQFVDGLPDNVDPDISPQSPTGEILRYTLRNPVDPDTGRPVYTLSDLKSIQDWVLERQFRRVPRVIDVVSGGGTIKRYEIRPDPERMARYGITLDDLSNAISQSNANVGGDYLSLGENMLNVRGIGLIGGGIDAARSLDVVRLRDDPAAAARLLREDETQRLFRIRQTVIRAVNGIAIRVGDVVEGGPLQTTDEFTQAGVVVGNLPRLGRVSQSLPVKKDGRELLDESGGRVWIQEPEKIQGIVLLRKGEASLPTLQDLDRKIDELNKSTDGRLLPNVTIEPYYDRKDLISVTTETVRENLLTGMILVTLILLMFVSNVRSALIVAVNIPLALLFAFGALFLRGESANLLSIGAVDFGIIVDSSVIMVENIYRILTSGEHSDLPLKERILRACHEVERGLFFTTMIMMCAFMPLFLMRGPEGQIFGPMAHTYAFALGGALLMAITLAPVLCLIFFRDLKPKPDNILVRLMKARYLDQLEWCLRHRYTTLGAMGFLIALTVALLPALGREFMPELEEGNLWIRGTFPVNITLEQASARSDEAREIMERYPEVETIVAATGRPDDGTDPTGFYNTEFFVPLKRSDVWPKVKTVDGWKRHLSWLFGPTRRRTKEELIREMNADLKARLGGVNWNFSQNIRDNVMESLSGVKGDNSVKIFGTDLDDLERAAIEVKSRLEDISGITNVGVFHTKGQPNLEIPVDVAKCNRWGVSVSDVEDVIQTAVGGKSFSTMIEGEKRFDIALRYPESHRNSDAAILNIPVDVSKNKVVSSSVPTIPGSSQTGSAMGISVTGMNIPMPAVTGSQFGGTINDLTQSPRRRLGDFVTPLDASGRQSPDGRFVRSGASTIYREQGERMVAVKFSVRGRDLAGAVADAKDRTAGLFQAPLRAEWSGEFQEMEEAERRLQIIIPVSLALIFVMLYLAFRSFLDVFVVISNVVDVSIGGIWALLLTGTHFSISAAVGFISLFGVAIMDGLLMISYFNQLRLRGRPLHDAIMEGAEKRVRPITMTALTAILGLLPAALSTRIGAQTQRPLAIVIVGGMLTTLFLTRYLMPVLYSFYGNRTPNEHGGSVAH
jgi:heavy metal efflux system protein